MGEILHIINADVELPEGMARKRAWMEPGYPTVVVPGLVLTLMVDRYGDIYKLRLVSGPRDEGGRRGCHAHIMAVARAIQLDTQNRPARALIELAYDASCITEGGSHVRT